MFSHSLAFSLVSNDQRRNNWKTGRMCGHVRATAAESRPLASFAKTCSVALSVAAAASCSPAQVAVRLRERWRPPRRVQRTLTEFPCCPHPQRSLFNLTRPRLLLGFIAANSQHRLPCNVRIYVCLCSMTPHSSVSESFVRLLLVRLRFSSVFLFFFVSSELHVLQWSLNSCSAGLFSLGVISGCCHSTIIAGDSLAKYHAWKYFYLW